MPAILPIKDLKNTAKISALCEETDGPVFITKNGYGAMVLMSLRHYEEAFARMELYRDLDEAEADIAAGRVAEVKTSLAELRKRFGL